MYIVWIGLWWALIAARMICSGVKKTKQCKKQKTGWDWGETDERTEAYNQHGWEAEKRKKEEKKNTVCIRL